MTIQDTRRARLAQLITSKPYLSQAEFVRATGENQGEISALLKDKSFGEKKARSIEKKCGLPEGWLDVEAQPKSTDEQLQRVNQEESALLTLFRGTDADGRASVLQAALSVRQLH